MEFRIRKTHEMLTRYPFLVDPTISYVENRLRDTIKKGGLKIAEEDEDFRF